MKTLIGKTAAALALALMTTGAFAANNDAPKKEMVPNEVKTTLTADKDAVDLELNINNATEGASTVIVTDVQGNVVFTDTFEHEGNTVTKNYQIDQAPFGDYLIRVVTAEPTLQK